MPPISTFNTLEQSEAVRLTPDPDALLIEANHRIANDLSLIVGLVRFQAASLANGPAAISAAEVRGMLDEVARRITTVGQLHRLLSHAPRVGEVELGNYLRQVCRPLVESLSSPEDVELTEDFQPGCLVRSDQILPLALVAAELTTNALKYSHPTGVPGRIKIGCHRTPDGILLLEVVDDGIGLPEDFDAASDGGVGLKIVRTLADQLGAELRFEANGIGLTVSLSLPTPELARLYEAKPTRPMAAAAL